MTSVSVSLSNPCRFMLFVLLESKHLPLFQAVCSLSQVFFLDCSVFSFIHHAIINIFPVPVEKSLNNKLWVMYNILQCCLTYMLAPHLKEAPSSTSFFCPLHDLWRTLNGCSYSLAPKMAFLLPFFHKAQICGVHV
ncbi:hypothetical protein AMECASPLE_038673 [Ameca splendens]|uniref:Uncharacterized protein n=1 Tax=Ameca splendens TaxID=208324 RepID=A0ABV1AEQ2_9TELE